MSKSKLQTVNTMTPLLPIVWVLLTVMAASIAVVYSKHVARGEFKILYKLEQQRDKLNEEWGRLLLEQSTWASPNRIERDAVLRLHMVAPTADMTVVIYP